MSEINIEKKDKTYTQRPVNGALDKKSGHLYGGLGGHRRQPWKQGPAKVPLGSACTQENFLVNTFPTKTIPSKYPSLQENPLEKQPAPQKTTLFTIIVRHDFHYKIALLSMISA